MARNLPTIILTKSSEGYKGRNYAGAGVPLHLLPGQGVISKNCKIDKNIMATLYSHVAILVTADLH